MAGPNALWYNCHTMIVMGVRKLGNYRSICQLRPPGDARRACGDPGLGMVKGRRWARCKGGIRGKLRLVAPVTKPLSPLPAPPPLPKETMVDSVVLRGYLGDPKWSQWTKLMKLAGVELPSLKRVHSGKGWATQAAQFSPEECRKVMEAFYERRGRRRLNSKSYSKL